MRRGAEFQMSTGIVFETTRGPNQCQTQSDPIHLNLIMAICIHKANTNKLFIPPIPSIFMLQPRAKYYSDIASGKSINANVKLNLRYMI